MSVTKLQALPIGLIPLAAQEALAILQAGREDKHLHELDELLQRSRPKYVPAKSAWRYIYGELRAAINGTHRNGAAYTNLVYGRQLRALQTPENKVT